MPALPDLLPPRSAPGASTPAFKGGLIVASNHRSFLDPFVIGALLPWRRPMHYVAKVELFEKRWQGWILYRLGAFPIRRGQSDEEAMETARADRSSAAAPSASSPRAPGSARGSLGAPEARRRPPGAARPGAAVLPVAVHGTEQVRRGWRIRPRKVKAARRAAR